MGRTPPISPPSYSEGPEPFTRGASALPSSPFSLYAAHELWKRAPPFRGTFLKARPALRGMTRTHANRRARAKARTL
jgi:hypothetical protein